MDTLSVKVPEALADAVDEYAADNHDGNTSAAVRELLQDGLDADAIASENDRLQNQLQTLIEERQEKQELVRYVEDERTAQEQWRRAGLFTKAKWAVTGMPEDE